MKILTIALKDLLQSSRSLSIYIFMFVIPILVTVLFFVIFGDIGSNGDSFELPTTSVVIANLDEGEFPLEDLNTSSFFETANIETQELENLGDLLVALLVSDVFSDLITLSEVDDAETARRAVDSQETGVAVVIPPDFTETVTGPLSNTNVRIYKDPALTFGPMIVESIVNQIIEGFSASKITVSVAIDQLIAAGVPMEENLLADTIRLYSDFSSAGGSALQNDQGMLVETQLPSGQLEPTNLISEIVSTILAGMMVFFAFYTGSASMQTILVEEEKGTLSRLFTTPSSIQTILTGKSLAAVLTLIIQVIVLLAFGRLVFGINWGDFTAVFLSGIGLVVIASSTGLFLVSMLDNTRQGGIVFGGVLTLTGMLGLVPVFTAGVPNQPEAVQLVSLFVPQGWAVRGFMIGIDGGGPPDVLPSVGVSLIWSLFFVIIGQYRLQRRFA